MKKSVNNLPSGGVVPSRAHLRMRVPAHVCTVQGNYNLYEIGNIKRRECMNAMRR